MNKIKSCIYCGQWHQHLLSVKQDPDFDKEFYVLCHSCLCRGPLESTAEDAVREWDEAGGYR